ncbi:helix-turn-helix domain-containing protein [Pelagicoccus mobilis]|uniref:AraC family transcriptional regulator n=1 Tax=Pelagicoccus mobilis TaxID=415221 RepID=A0A934RW04_9BACT|nr:helix-turn-helix domain-containing protein [Pelagicoccus mobilis]MBK1875442.1 AraC family transcriptional regulator [Pelagicoccus mobilis]
MNEAFNRYIPASDEAKRWGLTLTDLGYTQIPAGSAYPPGEHPDSYAFNVSTGRVLTEYQVIYITRGEGSFWSQVSGEQAIKAGSLFLLFPGVRHRYQPNPQTGWDEHWIGFIGDHAERLMNEFFNPQEPVIQVGMNSDLRALFATICDLTEHEGFGFRRIIAAKAIEILARVQTLSQGESLRSPHNEKMIRQTCCLLNDALRQKFDFNAHATENGMSYTSFRRLFKQHTGLSPNQYLLELRIRKAQSLLTNTTLSVQRISEETGFESSFYFSRFFKQRMGLSPLNYRKAHR